MTEKNVTLCNKILYYIVAPLLLLYFFLIDSGLAKCSLTILGVFLVVIGAMITIHLTYQKNNYNYKFLVNSLYGKIMVILVVFELSYNLYK